MQTDLWFSTVLRSIGDAVVACDASGAVVFMNPVAETLTGWTEQEALTLPLKDVFRIIHEETRKPVESPVDKVRRLGKIVGLANHTLLLRRDGTEISIDDSGAPIHAPGGALTGVVLIFRDITGRRRAERNLELLSESGRTLAGSLFFQPTLEDVARLCTRTFADFCYFDLIHEDGSPDRINRIERIVRVHRDPAMQPILDEGSDAALPLSPNHPVTHSLQQHKTSLVPHIDDAWMQSIAVNPVHLRCMRQLQLHSLLTVPVSEGDRTLGMLTFCRTSNPTAFDQEDAAIAEELALRVAATLIKANLLTPSLTLFSSTKPH